MKQNILPPILKTGDLVAIVSPAGRVPEMQVQKAKERLESWGLHVQISSHALDRHFQYASTDENRLMDFQEALNNPEVRAIFCSRGGYGSIRIIDKLDFSAFIKNPKWVVGFSDISLIHAHINHNLGVASIHGPMSKSLAENEDETSLEYLKDQLFGRIVMYGLTSDPFNKKGNAEGILIGGNLAILTSLIGTAYDFNPKGKILFIEDIGEYLYRIDRMMWQLKQAGKLEGLSGLIVGQFSDMKDNDNPFGKNAYEIIAEHLSEYNFPVCFGFPAGHETVNFPLLFNTKCSLAVDNSCVLALI